MSEFKTIPLKEIRPDPNQPRKFFNPVALKELTESVKSKGVLQPILVRPNGTGYILVCGERRFKAAQGAGLADIPASIKTLTDQEALEIQFIENIQRDDVHPMDEAVTFKAMIENKLHPYSLEDIGAKINKPATYVAHRLALNNLIPELQKEFWSGKFLIGHAILFARLTPADQKEATKECKQWNSKEYKSLVDTKEFISRNIMRQLSAAPFKRDDATLVPAAGPCTTCTKRSGCNKLLFDDIKEDDRCFDKKCFTEKVDTWTLNKVKSVLEEGENLKLLLRYNDPVLKEIAALAKSHDVALLKQYDDFSFYSDTGYKKEKGMWVNGSDAGKVIDIYIKGASKPGKGLKGITLNGKEGAPSNAAIDYEIEAIKHRTKRAAELDDEKVWQQARVLSNEKDLLIDTPLNETELTALMVAMYQKSSYDKRKRFETFLNKSSADSLSKTTVDQKTINKLCRFFISDVLNDSYGSHVKNGPQRALMAVLKHYFPEKILAIETEQSEKRVKREANAAKRIAALQEQKKPVASKPKEAKPAAKKAAPKKAVKKVASKKIAKKKA